MIPCAYINKRLTHSEAHLEHSQTSKIEPIVEMVSGLEPLTIFANSSILDVWLASKYASVYI